MPKKCILILLDGIGDRSYEQFDFQTPLQTANTPVLDALSKGGANGMYHAASLGQALPSENAHFFMFGYDMPEFPGRGALEALGAGIKLDIRDVAVLSHFACLREFDNSLILAEGKPKATKDEVDELIKRVKAYQTDGIEIRFNPTGGIRGIITLQGHVSPYFTDSDPFVDGHPLVNVTPWADYQKDTGSQNAATALKEYLTWAYHQLKNHPINQSRKKKGLLPITGLVTQRAGQLKTIPSFTARYGLRGLSMASGMVYWGLSTYIGLDIEKVRDTGEPGRDITDRLKRAHTLINDYDVIHIHTKTPDEAAHTKDPALKKSVIESLDKGIGEGIKPFLDDPEVFIIITADHSTPSEGPLIHSGESVPLTFHGRGVRRDNVARFDEVSTASGALGVVRGKELMYLILNHLDRSKLHGIMDTPIDQPFWPGNYEPFKIEK